MDAMSDNTKLDHAQAIAQLLDEHRAGDTVALDVREICSFADYFVITTVTSQGHLRGLMPVLDEFLHERDLVPLRPRRRSSEVGWVLIDLGFVVVHLMTEEMRDFYELERLWFGAKNVFSPSEP
jgi:ribosome-associated protein